jgi:tRNA(Ile)-lysidine synthetase-like protein
MDTELPDTMEIPTTEIINFWFPNSNFDKISMFEFWFDTTPDDYIRTKYQYLVDYLSIFQTKTNYLSISQTKTDLDKLVLLIIGDQFTRNVYRNDLLQRTKNDFWTLDLALSMLDSDTDLKLNLNMRYFILLVLRHQKTTSLLTKVSDRIKLYISEYVESKTDIPSSLIKFYTHTIKSYTDLTDSIFCTETTTELPDTVTITERIYHIIHLSNYIDILDQNIYVQTQTQTHTQTLTQSETSINFISDSLPKDIIFETLYEWVKNFKQLIPINIGISLSGGVDSMVLLSCLVQIKYYFPALIGQIVAIHIEHSNRSEAIVERQFLIDFCKILGVRFYWRTIDYMCREMEYIDRSIYETESKKVRFNLYKFVSDKHNLVGICMGHHMGDITENVFTNIIKGRTISDLGVMKKTDFQHDVQIYRPLLDLIKDQIFSYAKQYQIPYFKNSTPPWSCRGVIRDKMIPILKAQFGDFEPNIIKMMTTCTKMSDLNHKYIIKPFIDSVIKFKHGTKVPYNFDMSDDIFWDPILIDLLHSNGYPMISTKSKNNFLTWLRGLNNFNRDKTNLCHDLNSIFYAYYNSETNNVYIINNHSIKQIPKTDLVRYGTLSLDHILSESELSDEVNHDRRSKKIRLPQKIKDMMK